MQYEGKQPKWGPTGYVTFKRTYARPKDDGTTEEFYDTLKRVVEGCYNIQFNHCKQYKLPWNAWKAQKSAQKMFTKMWNFKFLPPGRGLWLMGTPVVERIGSAGLNNCAFVSTKEMRQYPTRPFKFLMDMSMLGVGVGFDVLGAGTVEIKGTNKEKLEYQIGDDRESWVESLEKLLDHYLLNTPKPVFDYSLIRAAGEPIRGFGGTSSGPEPLKELHINIDNIFKKQSGKQITSEHIVDIMNYIGVCVVAGNVRRTAEIALGELDDETYLKLKQDEEKLMSHRWASNNSILAKKGMDYSGISPIIQSNGEPGFIWLENIQAYGRMKDGKNYKDYRAVGTNPCQPDFATVITPEGVRTFKDINIGDFIWSSEGWTKVLNKWETGTKPVYEYKTTTGVFVGTENHRLVTPNGKVEAKYAEQVLTISGPELNGVDFDNQVIVDGLFLGDGYFKKMKGRNYSYATLSIGKDDKDYFSSEIEEYLGNKMQDKGDNCEDFRVNTTITESEKKRAHVLEIPERYYLKDIPTTTSLLRGLYSADGSIVKSSKNSVRITYKSASKKLIEQVQLMLSSIGIRSYITTNKSKEVEFKNGTYECRESYDLNITKDFLVFYKNIGFIQEYKNEKIRQVIDFYKPSNKKTYGSIKEISYLGEYKVYDITVDNSSHTYWTGGLSVSNCGEQSLESFELCCLVETFPSLHDTPEEYLETLEYAYLYAKSVTLINTHWPETNAVMLRNRRIGTSQTGIIQAFERHGRRKVLNEFCDAGYQIVQKVDKQYSDWLCIPRSIKTTTVKPSGTVSLLAGVTPGIHYPHSEYYIRRIRFDKDDPILVELKKAGYNITPDVYSKTSDVVDFPVKEENFYKGKKDVTVWEQLENAAQYQHYWSDNQVSITVDITESDFDDMDKALELYESRLKSVSFLPYKDHGYELAPYEEIDEKTYNKMQKKLKKYDLSKIMKPGYGTKFCDGDSCEI